MPAHPRKRVPPSPLAPGVEIVRHHCRGKANLRHAQDCALRMALHLEGGDEVRLEAQPAALGVVALVPPHHPPRRVEFRENSRNYIVGIVLARSPRGGPDPSRLRHHHGARHTPPIPDCARSIERGEHALRPGRHDLLMYVLARRHIHLTARRHIIPCYFAAGSLCMNPNMFPSVSFAYASQPTPGIAIFGSAMVPPFAWIACASRSTESTSIVQT